MNGGEQLDVQALLGRLSPAAAQCLERMAEGELVGGHMPASLARRGLAEYAEHVDAWYRVRGEPQLVMRRGYTVSALGWAVIRAQVWPRWSRRHRRSRPSSVSGALARRYARARGCST